MEEFDKERLLNMVGAFIKVADADLVNNRKIFPCKKEDHKNYQTIRDSFQTMYSEADFTCSDRFLVSVKGKSDKFIQMKSKIFNEAAKKKAHREVLLDKLCSLATISEAREYINVQHNELYNQALECLEKCRIA